jgi:hypothetical protein
MTRTVSTAGVILLLCSGCAWRTYRGTYDPAAFANWRIAADQRVAGRALVMTTPEEDAFVWAGHQRGWNPTLVVPMGMVVREAAVRTFGGLFLGGAEAGSQPPRAGDERVVVTPRFKVLSHRLEPSTQRLAMEVSIQVSVLGPDRQVAFECTSTSKTWRAVRADFEPFEPHLMQAVQVATQDAMLGAARDVKAFLEGKGMPPAP